MLPKRKRCSCGKACYSKQGAKSARNFKRKRGVLLRIYKCPFCKYWHLTKHGHNREKL